MKIFAASLVFGIVAFSSVSFGSELILRDQKGPIAKLICSGENSEKIVENAKSEIKDRAVESFYLTEDGQLFLLLVEGAIVALKNGTTVCFIAQ